MTFLEIYLSGLVVIMLAMTILWITSLIIKDASIVDIFWGAGFVIAGLTYFVLTDGFETRKAIITIMVTLWGLRLTLHLGKRNIGKPEDYRYQNWRKQFGKKWWWLSYFRVFVLQGVILWLVSIPIIQAQYHTTPDNLTIFDYLGIIVWGIGLFFEAVGDWQLTRFKANPDNKGKVLNIGLWRYTRHPNYFGDAMIWWGVFLVALSTQAGFLTILAPLFMNFLLLRVSGVAMLERSLKKNKPEYAEYVEKTSAFIPMPPKQ